MKLSSPASARTPSSAARWVLGSLLAFDALNAFAGGWYGMSGARDVRKAWLRGTPFVDYFVPSLILFAVVGGALSFGAVAVFARPRFARVAAIGAGIVLLTWIATQLWLIGYVSWMQPPTAAAGLVILIVATRLPVIASRSPGQREPTR